MGELKIALDTDVFICFLEGMEPYAMKVQVLLNSLMRKENDGVLSTASIAEVLTELYTSKDEEEGEEDEKPFHRSY